LRAKLPGDAEVLLPWLLQQPQTEVLALLAFCLAVTVNGVQDDEGPSAYDALAEAAGLDLREWFTPTADNYFTRVSKERMQAVVTEAVSATAAAPLAKMKKSEAAQAAEKHLAGTGWLPEFLRGKA